MRSNPRSFGLAPCPVFRAFALTLFLATALSSAPQAAVTTTSTETFDGTIDQATWRVGTLDQIASTGGHSGAFLHNPQLDAAVPTPIFIGPASSPFLGNYSAADVISLGIDVNVYAAGIGVDHTRPISLVLGSDMGTPDDPSDDCEAYTVGGKLPQPGSGWKSYTFHVPSDRATLPAGWTIRGFCAGLSQDDAWKSVLSNVTRVTFPFADPDTLWYFQVWDLGIDSVRISSRIPGRPLLEPEVPERELVP